MAVATIALSKFALFYDSFTTNNWAWQKKNNNVYVLHADYLDPLTFPMVLLHVSNDIFDACFKECVLSMLQAFVLNLLMSKYRPTPPLPTPMTNV